VHTLSGDSFSGKCFQSGVLVFLNYFVYSVLLSNFSLQTFVLISDSFVEVF